MAESLASTTASLLSTLGISAIVAGISSAIINYIMTMREFRKRSHKSLIEERLNLYSYIIYHVDKMKYQYDALSYGKREISKEERYSYSPEEWDETVHAIDSKLQNRYYLLKH